MACDIWNGFKSKTEDFKKELYHIPSPPTPVKEAIPTGIFPAQVGTTRTVFRMANIEPTTDEPTWQDITLTSGDNTSGSCNTTYTEFSGGFEEETYSPVQFGMKGPILCRNDNYFLYEPDKWLTSYMKSLRQLADRQYENYMVARYTRRVPIGIADTTFTFSDASGALTGLEEAVSELTQDMLDVTAQELIYAGATNPDTQGYIQLDNSDNLIFRLLIGMEASKQIVLNNSEFLSNINYAWMGAQTDAPTLRKMGTGIVLKNFQHKMWLTPPRYTWAGGTYTRVNTWELVATTKGYKPRFTAAYRNAPFEGALVLSNQVMTAQFIKPPTTTDGTTWPDAAQGMGDWQFVTGKDAGCDDDPLNNRGRHFASWMLALEPGALPTAGRLLIFKRCSNNVAVSYCTS